MKILLPDWKSWLRTARPAGQEAVLDRRHVYILPTRQGLLFSLILLAMLIGSINYSLGMGFALTFLLAALGIVAMLHTWRNLANLALCAGRSAPVFAGEDARLQLFAAEHGGRARYAIVVQRGSGQPAYADIAAGDRSELALPIATTRRGWLSPGKLTVSTEFPLGLFHAWSYVELEQRCLVYPRPAPPGTALPLSAGSGLSGPSSVRQGDEDFVGLRPYQHGDSLRRIDWKASAREQGMLSKQFQGGSGVFLWLEWEAAAARDAEQRIAQLARWVLDAEATGLPYGLRLPSREIAPASGNDHYRACMEALALLEVAG